jgi:sugar phosphate isomerase/epimerase
VGETTGRIPYALTAYGFPHRMGYLATKDGEKHPAPMTAADVCRAAAEFGLSGVEFPLPADPSNDAPLRDLLAEHGLRYIPDYMSVLATDAEATRTFLRRAAGFGVPVVRALLSTILCGNRASAPGGWDAYVEAVAARLREVLPLAEELGVCVAMENHQDANTDDLLRLHERVGYSAAYGVVLDTGNPLAVGEEPVEAARRLAPLIRHVHLKDYTIHFAPEGYRLVRCVAGSGVIDFPAILAAVRGNGHNVLPGIEIAAQQTRTIPVLHDAWWTTFPNPEIGQFVGALRVLWAKGRPADEPYSSAWERGEGSEAISAEEWDIVTRSVAYFRGLELT